jgi:hypothetical protein
MLAGIIMTTVRMIPVVTLVAGLGLLVGIVSLGVYGAVTPSRVVPSGVSLTSPEAEKAS